ncbi:MAG: tryptophan 7-halogenase [Colwellia sp.]|jgi:Lycopene cyclase protein.
MTNQAHKEIAILGCGPAGIVTALGLAKMGYKVCVIAKIRPHNVTEGISERVFQALSTLGLQHTLKEISPPIPRSVSWNGTHSAANTERLIRRASFDAALLKDLADANIPFYDETIIKVETHPNTCLILCKSGKIFHLDFVVEARGRAAPLSKNSHIRGVNSLSICQNWQTSNTEIMSPEAIAISIESGWLWLANNGKGNIFTQVSVSAKSNTGPAKEKLSTFIQKLVLSRAELAHITPFIEPEGKVLARSSTPLFNKYPIKDRYLSVGDAAMSGDPLSGSGIFLSLSAALIAPVVINTILNKPQDKTLAETFYFERLQHLFYRFCRVGRDFYKMESRWQEHPFWQERREWPDQVVAHQEKDQIIGSAKRPVVNGNFIEQKEVVITVEQPLGIWKINNKNAVDLLSEQLKNLNFID